MIDETLRCRAFHAIMKQMRATGQAPHYIELGKMLELGPERGRRVLHDLFSSGIAGWLHPDTDLVASFAPFNNLPTMYRISVDGRQKWFGQ